METRRDAIRIAVAGALAAGAPAVAAPSSPSASPPAPPSPRGVEGRRVADLGNGTYRNPVLAGDYADPTVLKDGDDYYLTHSAFDASPGLLIWHSRDLVNWTPVTAALPKSLGTVFAPDLVRHGGRYYIYIPFMRAPWSGPLPSFANIHVIHADNIAGPWSEPIDLGIGGFIDPGHAVGEDGSRWLFLSGVSRICLADDGLSTIGKPEHVYDGWQYPDDWIVEGFSLEGPKLMRRGEWFYLFSAVGGTSGPATGHMVIVARSRSIDGPWVNAPANPIVRTRSDAEPWHSRGHATAVEGPGGQWYLVYHAYENGFHTLGRQTLLEPIDWTADGWPVARGGDLARPLPFRSRGPVPLPAQSDRFEANSLGTRWTVQGGRPATAARIGGGALAIAAAGHGPQDGTVVAQPVGERRYWIEASFELDPGAEGGLLLWFSDRLFFGMGCTGERMITWAGGRPSYWQEPMPAARRFHLAIANDAHILTLWWSLDGKSWTRHGNRFETSGCHANTIGELASLRPALYAAGSGEVRCTGFRFAALA